MNRQDHQIWIRVQKPPAYLENISLFCLTKPITTRAICIPTIMDELEEMTIEKRFIEIDVIINVHLK